MNLILGLFSGKQGIRRVILVLSIFGLFLWLQLSAFSTVVNMIQAALQGTESMEDISWISQLRDTGQMVVGFNAFWTEWGLIISLAGLALGILLSNSPFKLVGQLGVIAFVIVLALPYLLNALFTWITESGFAPEFSAGVGPILIAANEQLQEHSLPILIGAAVVAITGFGIHFLYKKGTAPRSIDPGAALT